MARRRNPLASADFMDRLKSGILQSEGYDEQLADQLIASCDSAGLDFGNLERDSEQFWPLNFPRAEALGKLLADEVQPGTGAADVCGMLSVNPVLVRQVRCPEEDTATGFFEVRSDVESTLLLSEVPIDMLPMLQMEGIPIYELLRKAPDIIPLFSAVEAMEYGEATRVLMYLFPGAVRIDASDPTNPDKATLDYHWRMMDVIGPLFDFR